MTQFYVGVKIIEAWQEEKNGKDGYAVKYPDGYVSWSPKNEFEKAYYPINYPLDETYNGIPVHHRVTNDMINGFIASVSQPKKVDGFDSDVIEVKLLTGSYCFTKDEPDGLRKAKRKLAEILDFVLCWGRYGLFEKKEDLIKEK